MTVNKASLRYGYARVSTRDQTTDTQVEQLERLGIDRAYIVTEKRLGKKDRPVLNDLVNEMQNGDEPHVTKLDRLGRNIRQLDDTAKKLDQKALSSSYRRRPKTTNGCSSA